MPDRGGGLGGAPATPGHPVGLRVDVTSRHGMEVGLPRLAEVFASSSDRASLFLGMGPDRTGVCLLPYLLHPFRIPAAARRANLLGLPMPALASGLLLPARPPAPAGAETVHRMVAGGHEAGCLGYDYWKWVAEIPRGAAAAPFALLDQEAALEAFRETFGFPPAASASPGFICSEETLRAKESHSLRYASDFRGTDPFLPIVAGKAMATPQVPVTLPTISELLSERGATAAHAFETLLGKVLQERWPVLRIRAESEGGALLGPFTRFLEDIRAAGRTAVPLGKLLEFRLAEGPLPRCTISYGELEGRPGIVSLQMFEV